MFVLDCVLPSLPLSNELTYGLCMHDCAKKYAQMWRLSSFNTKCGAASCMTLSTDLPRCHKQACVPHERSNLSAGDFLTTGWQLLQLPLQSCCSLVALITY